MSYQALYRVWRPQTFDELVGQPVITETLKNAIANQQTSHAYLFTGPRGTGKTSAAKILAKAINCPHQENGNPCNACDLCRAISQGQLSDVVEIDAASNNGVDEIRQLRDNVRYAASQAKYKVYIIDEVHMLTTGAFNALLKTLEEPPESVIFVLATTEPHKIPATIISRTQRFDFQRITQHHLVSRMVEILDHDQISFEDSALDIIARAANGGMRDSLSLLDQALSYNNQAVTVDSALEVSGSLSQMAFVDYLLAVFQGQGEEALKVLDLQLQKGKQANRFVEELILFARDVLLSTYANLNQTLLSDKELTPLKTAIPMDFFYKLIDQLNHVQDKMRFSSQTDLYLEVMTIQLAQGIDDNVKESPVTSPNLDQLTPILSQLQAQVETLSKKVQDLQAQVGQVQSAKEIKQDEQDNLSDELENSQIPSEPMTRQPRPRPQFTKADYQFTTEEIYYVLNQATHQDIQKIKSAWDKLLSLFSPQERAKFVSVQPLAAGPGLVLISFKDPVFAGIVQNDLEILRKFYQNSEKLLGQGYYVLVIAEKDWHSTRMDYTVLRKNHQNQPIPIDSNLSQQIQDRIKAMANKLTEDRSEIVSPELEQIEPVFKSPQEDFEFEPDCEIDQEIVEPEENLPLHVSKAIELFGEENINIIYEN